MEAKELRIGNYVNDHDNYLDEIIMISFDRLLYLKNYGNIHIRHIKPIPLTEDWLLKFGFEKNNDLIIFKPSYYIEIQKTPFYLRPSYKGGYYWGFMNDKRDCELHDVINLKYIHTLQNLYFSLCGKLITDKS